MTLLIDSSLKQIRRISLRNNNLTEKKNTVSNSVKAEPVNKNFSKANNFWNHDAFNHIIEHLIAALDQYDMAYRTFAI